MFDIDNTICKTKSFFYDKAKPKKKIIKIINQLYDNNYYIKFFTGRYMGRNNENSKYVAKKYYLKTKKQLESWNVKFHELIMGKPSYDLHFDDKTYNSLDKEFVKIISKLK